MPRAEPNTPPGGDPGRAAAIDGWYARGLELIEQGALFEAHEQLELAWRVAPPQERDFYQGLVHVAVAWYQAGRGRPLACERQLEKARRRLAPFGRVHRDLQVGELVEQVERALVVVRSGSLALAPPTLERRAAPPRD